MWPRYARHQEPDEGRRCLPFEPHRAAVAPQENRPDGRSAPWTAQPCGGGGPGGRARRRGRAETPCGSSIRATEEQRARWHATAEARGVSLSELVRQGLDGVRAVRRRHQPRRVDPELLRELARIGNNLNQLARWATARSAVPTRWR